MEQPIEVTACRSCGSDDLTPILSLGEQTISCFPKPGEPVHRAPLDLLRCQKCTLVQLRHSCPGNWLYDWYGYRSGINPMMVEALRDVTQTIEATVALAAGDIVADIGSNDGTLLRLYSVSGLLRVGFEPARNLGADGGAGLSLFVNDYFSAHAFELFMEAHGQAKVVTAISMFYDLDDPISFLREVRSILQDDGLLVIQQNYLLAMLQSGGFDNVCVEHVAYYSLMSLFPALEAAGFRLIDATTNPVNGGSFRVICVPRGCPRTVPGGRERIAEMYDREVEARLDKFETYQAFRIGAELVRGQLCHLVETAVSKGDKVYVYGASTRGLTLLQFCGLDSRLIAGAAERNPEKWGRMYADTGIPCVPEAEARDKADYFLILPWIFLDEFIRREESFLRRGGKFIVPLPNVSIISHLSTSPISLLKEVHVLSVKAA